MKRRKKFKRLIRTRMRKTGERYCEARTQLLKSRVSSTKQETVVGGSAEILHQLVEAPTRFFQMARDASLEAVEQLQMVVRDVFGSLEQLQVDSPQQFSSLVADHDARLAEASTRFFQMVRDAVEPAERWRSQVASLQQLSSLVADHDARLAEASTRFFQMVRDAVEPAEQ